MHKHSLNLDFSQRLAISAHQLAWAPAPAPKVWRKQFEREAPERGRETSLVRYQAGSRFPAHTHTLGEEILVLEGVLSDEHGDYPSGTYLRNPPGSTHTPYSENGCILFAKQDHFQPDDDQHIVISTDEMIWTQIEGGASMAILHEYKDERTAMVRWPQGLCTHTRQCCCGEEFLILEGQMADEESHYPGQTWIRNSHTGKSNFVTEEGALVFMKIGHLPITE